MPGERPSRGSSRESPLGQDQQQPHIARRNAGRGGRAGAGPDLSPELISMIHNEVRAELQRSARGPRGEAGGLRGGEAAEVRKLRGEVHEMKQWRAVVNGRLDRIEQEREVFEEENRQEIDELQQASRHYEEQINRLTQEMKSVDENVRIVKDDLSNPNGSMDIRLRNLKNDMLEGVAQLLRTQQQTTLTRRRTSNPNSSPSNEANQSSETWRAEAAQNVIPNDEEGETSNEDAASANGAEQTGNDPLRQVTPPADASAQSNLEEASRLVEKLHRRLL